MHGIGGNLTFDPYNKSQQGRDWHASDIRVPSLRDEVHAAGRTTADVAWPVSVGRRWTGTRPCCRRRARCG